MLSSMESFCLIRFSSRNIRGTFLCKICPIISDETADCKEKTLFKPGQGADRGTVTVRKLQRTAAEPEEVIAAQMEILQIFQINDILFPEQDPVAGQIIHGIDTDGIHADALVGSGQDIIQHLHIHTGKIAEVGIRAPVFVPAKIEQQKICRFCLAAISADMGVSR